MTTTRFLLSAVLIAACGGGKKAETTPAGDEPAMEQPAPIEEPVMVSAETMDQITRLFERKGTAVSRCLSMVIDNKDLPKSSRGKITLGVTISTAGKAEDIKVIKTMLDSAPLTECVVEKVREIQFPEVPRPYQTSYTYAFEAN
jgi:hypothetical protein